MKTETHIEKVMAGDISPRIVERFTKNGLLFVAWTPTWEGPARYDWPAANADLAERIRSQPRPSR